ncbi:class I adenylate-forming enzyme family protein [Streptomyces sp. NPDC006487]|uniref:class I adenylate-forming enzyme family protein n=1 Tax=Streptomyces sp. NPDC006487 TaxID=3364748 RepID=UPI0036A15A66
MDTSHQRLDTLLTEACDRFSGQTALTSGTQSLTYAELAATASEMSVGLAAAGHRSGEPVLLSVGNRCADIPAQLAIWRAGGIVVPVHHGVPRTVLRETALRTGARLLVRPEQDRPADRVGRLDLPTHPAPRELDADQALVAFTSGSTGRPKGVVLSHRAFTAKLRAIAQVLPFRSGDRAVQVLQLNFTFGQWTSLLTLATGGTLELVEQFGAASVLRRLAERSVQRIAVVPSMLRLINRELDAPGTGPSLRTALREAGSPALWITGGEPLPAGLGRRLRAALPGTGIADVYGLSETSTSDFILTPDQYEAGAGTIGRPGPGVEFRIVPDEGLDAAAPGVTGELCLRTPYLMTGYLDDPSATAEATAGGWLRTGDLATVREADGLVRLVGRKKQLISRGGVKIAPLEVENVYSRHPDCGGCLAVGVPDPMLGERVHLLFVPAVGSNPTEDELRAYGRERLEEYKAPERVHLVAELPLGRTGKADRAAAAHLAEAAHLADTVRPAGTMHPAGTAAPIPAAEPQVTR